MTAVIDSAGAFKGGAARFMRELDVWAERAGADLAVIGRGVSLTPSWMAQREVVTDPKCHRIALNNVSFLRRGGTKSVLLRNALHFCSSGELRDLNFSPPLDLRAQVPVVRAATRRADLVVVPCTSMAERVVHYLPSVRDRIVVRFHPVTPRAWAGSPAPTRSLLVPIINSPYKRLAWHLSEILSCLPGTGIHEIRVTAYPEEFPAAVASNSAVRFLGHLTSKELDRHFAECAAVYFPTQLEAFGYPLAEARANGRRVVALNTAQNREIAGAALSAYELGNRASLTLAMREAIEHGVHSDPEPFDPAQYFDWLTSAPR